MSVANDLTYALSCYLSPPGDLTVFSDRHDQCVALWRRSASRVELVRYWELERVSGQKHHDWPLFSEQRAHEFLDRLLSDEGLSLADVDTVWGTPSLPASAPVVVPDDARDFPVHSLAHLYSGLLMDTRLFREETIYAMAVDGAPDTVLDSRPARYWYAGAVSTAGVAAHVPVESPGQLYTAASSRLGLEPGSLMALATASRATVDFDVAAAVDRIGLLGGRNDPWADANALVRDVIAIAREQLAGTDPDSSFSPEDNLRSAVMKHVQRACELVSIRNVERLQALTDVPPHESYLSFSGGFGLNCPTSTMLLDRFGFRGLLTPPCANDSGQALGLGLLGLHGEGAFATADFRLDSAFHGMPVRDLDASLTEFASWIESVSDFDESTFVSDVTDGVIVWVDGNAEIGPRSLGHRSLLGDPRSTKVKDLLNEYKQRQWWRPVAPIVLAEHAEAWFAGDRLSPYMLEAVQIRADRIDAVPAIAHLDGTARHQTLSADVDPRLHAAIEAFAADTGVPILCNTSLNNKGEPIVNTAAEALTYCLSQGIDTAYITGRRIRLRPQEAVGLERPVRPRQREVGLFADQEAVRDAIWQSGLDRGLTEAALFLLSWSPTPGLAPDAVNRLATHLLETDTDFPGMVADFCRTRGPGSAFILDPADLPEPVIVE